MARAAVRDDLYGVHQQLTAQVLESTDAADSAPARVAAWEDADEELVGRAAATLDEICREETAELARLSVGLRVVRGLLS
jgi:glutamate dehydrogenase